MAMGRGQEAGGQSKSARRRGRRTAWLLGLPVVVGVSALGFYLWDRPPVPAGITVVSLQSLLDSGATPGRLWAGDQPRSVRLLAEVGGGPVRMAGTAGPSGVQVDEVTLPEGASSRDSSPVWHGDAVAYVDKSAGGTYICSPWWATPRKLTDLVVPGDYVRLTWFSDGDRLSVVVSDGEWRVRGVRIFSSDGDLIADVPISTTDGHWYRTLWSPSGRRLLLWEERMPHKGVVLSEPDWRAAPERLSFPHQWPRLWVNDDVLVSGTFGPSGYPHGLRFSQPLDGEELGSFDCSEVILGGGRVAIGLLGARAAPSGGGVIAGILGIASGAEALDNSARRFYVWDAGWLGSGAQTLRWWARDWPPPRVAYVYVPISGRGAQTIAIDNAQGSRSFAVSADGTELLYVSDWELKAAPLPAEARAGGGEME